MFYFLITGPYDILMIGDTEISNTLFFLWLIFQLTLNESSKTITF